MALPGSAPRIDVGRLHAKRRDDRRASRSSGAEASPTPMSDHAHPLYSPWQLDSSSQKINVVNDRADVVSSQIERGSPLTRPHPRPTIGARCHTRRMAAGERRSATIADRRCTMSPTSPASASRPCHGYSTTNRTFAPPSVPGSRARRSAWVSGGTSSPRTCARARRPRASGWSSRTCSTRSTAPSRQPSRRSPTGTRRR